MVLAAAVTVAVGRKSILQSMNGPHENDLWMIEEFIKIRSDFGRPGKEGVT